MTSLRLWSGPGLAGSTSASSPGGSPPTRISDATSLAAYRIVQESLTNDRRHAPGAPVTLRLHFNAEMLALAIDNGPSLTANDKPASPGVGIEGMTERATAIGGQLAAGPTADGFRVQAALALRSQPVIRVLVADDQTACATGSPRSSTPNPTWPLPARRATAAKRSIWPG